MAFVWILSLVFFVGASSASHLAHNAAAFNSTTNSTVAAFPSVVQVEVLQPWGVWQQRGAATILNSRYILSAASVFSGPDYSPFYRRIRAGSNFQSSGGIINYVEKENNYPSSNSTQASDISVVRLASVFVYSPLIQVAPIVASGTIIPNGLTLTQTGWGYGNFSSDLSAAPIVTVSTNQCGLNQTNFNVTTNSLCANLIQDNVSNADPGSPWFFGNVTIGIVSAANFGNSSWTGILSASVAAYTDWIVRTAV